MIVGHSMGGMLAARFATQYPGVDRAAGALQPDRPRRSRDSIGRGTAPTRATSERSASTYQTIRAQHHALRRAQPGGVDAGVRDLHAHPLRVDAQRRLAAAGDGADADRPGAVSRSGRRRLGAHQGADAGVRRRRRQPAGIGRGVQGADEVRRRHHPERQRPAAPASRPRPRAAHGSAGQDAIRRSSRSSTRASPNDSGADPTQLGCADARITPIDSGEKNCAGEIVPAFIWAKPSLPA